MTSAESEEEEEEAEPNNTDSMALAATVSGESGPVRGCFVTGEGAEKQTRSTHNGLRRQSHTTE